MLTNAMDPNQTEDPADGAGAPNGTAPEHTTDRSKLERELLDEMLGWLTRDRGGVFKTWHRHSLSLVHLNVLSALETEGPLSMRRLAEAMDVSDASATGIVDRMEKRGIVERRHATGDRRVVLVYSTDTGKLILRDMADHRIDALSKVLTLLSEEEMAALLVGIRAVIAARRRIIEADPRSNASPSPETPPAE
jgi:DNA-binding MarR family transcriptional regulator